MLLLVIAVVVVVALIAAALSVRIVKQYELGVLFRLGRVVGVRPAGPRPPVVRIPTAPSNGGGSVSIDRDNR